MRFHVLAVAVAAGSCSVCLAVPAAQAAGPGKGSLEQKAVGTWQMTVDPRPVQGPNGPIDVPRFPSLVSLQHGGTLTDAVSSLAGAASVLLGADDYTNGLGAWSVSKKTLKFRFQRYFTKSGQYVGSQVVTGRGRIRGGRTTQVATAAFFDATGTQIGPSITIDAKGKRLGP